MLWRNMLRSGETLTQFSEEYRVALPGEGIRWYQSTGQPERLGNGDIAWDGVVMDITDRKEAELANDVLSKATKTKNQFLANMSHELRTPLSAILATAEGLQQGVFEPNQHAECFGVIEKSSLHLRDLINEILDLSKIESGNMVLNLKECDVHQLCKSIFDVIAIQSEHKSIELILDVPEPTPKLVADETRLKQILLNLLSNAIKFTGEHGKVKLAVADAKASINGRAVNVLQFSIHDTGIGIENSQIEKLFEPFVQVDSSLSRPYEGTGLGLTLVKELVEMHSGSVTVQSELGVGSCFTVNLPIAESRTAIENQSIRIDAKSETSEIHTKKKHGIAHSNGSDGLVVLLAEDNPTVADTFKLFLSANGFRVIHVSNGREAIESAIAKRPNLILMDVQMPILDGLEAIKQIRQISSVKDTPIIAISGFAMESDSERCIQAGADLFISKPCTMQNLISQVRSMVCNAAKASLSDFPKV